MEKRKTIKANTQMESNIRIALQQSNVRTMPNFCQLLKSKKGYVRAERIVLKKMLQGKWNIGQCMEVIESELS